MSGPPCRDQKTHRTKREGAMQRYLGARGLKKEDSWATGCMKVGREKGKRSAVGKSGNTAGALKRLLMTLHDRIPHIFVLRQPKVFRPNQRLFGFRKIFNKHPVDPDHQRGYVHVI